MIDELAVTWDSPIGTDYDAAMFPPTASISRRLRVLRRFCGKCEYRYWMKEPWTVGEWSYATDNKICIRVESVGVESRPPEGRRLPDVSSLPWNEIATEQEWVEIPDLPKLRFKFNGTTWEPVQTPVRFDGSRMIVDAHLLERIKSLPGIVVNAERMKWNLLFKFDFGVGVMSKYMERQSA